VPSITANEVRSEVARFWNAFTAKAPELLEEFYAPDATAFASFGSRASLTLNGGTAQTGMRPFASQWHGQSSTDRA
jgi:hypothetical protein